jgi:hypothetical protein
MPIRWSSNYVMCDHAEKWRLVNIYFTCFLLLQLITFKFVDRFVTEISWEEPKLAKSVKLHVLKLSDSKWKHLKAFIDLLGVSLNIELLRLIGTNEIYNAARRQSPAGLLL